MFQRVFFVAPECLTPHRCRRWYTLYLVYILIELSEKHFDSINSRVPWSLHCGLPSPVKTNIIYIPETSTLCQRRRLRKALAGWAGNLSWSMCRADIWSFHFLQLDVPTSPHLRRICVYFLCVFMYTIAKVTWINNPSGVSPMFPNF